MGKSKWNNCNSYVISELSESEFKEAIHEWAEGSQYLEELLWECHRNGVVTSGSHVGKHWGYLGITVTDSSDKLQNLLEAAWKLENTEIFITFCGNPYASPEWYKSDIRISPKKDCDIDAFFASLTECFKKPVPTCSNGLKHCIELCDFLDDKESGLCLIFEKEGGKMTISVTCRRSRQFFAELFEKIGLKDYGKVGPSELWALDTEDEEVFNDCILKFLEVLKANWTLELPTEIDGDMDLHDIALVMRRKFGTNPAGIEAFNTWLEESRNDFLK